MKYLRRSRRAKIIYFTGESIWTSLKSKNFAVRVPSKLNPQIQKGEIARPPKGQGEQEGQILVDENLSMSESFMFQEDIIEQNKYRKADFVTVQKITIPMRTCVPVRLGTANERKH
jgi:hypothetical protein